MPEMVLRKFTLTAYDDDTVEVDGVEGFPFDPVCVLAFNDFDHCDIFVVGNAWSLQNIKDSVAMINSQLQAMPCTREK